MLSVGLRAPHSPRLHAPPGRPGPEGRQGALRVTGEPPPLGACPASGPRAGGCGGRQDGATPLWRVHPGRGGRTGLARRCCPRAGVPTDTGTRGAPSGAARARGHSPLPLQPSVCPPPAAVAGRPAQTVLTSADGHTFHGHRAPPTTGPSLRPRRAAPHPSTVSVGTRAPSLGGRSPGKLLLDSPGSEPGAGRPASRATGRGIGPHQHAVTTETRKLPLSPGGWNEPVTERHRVTGEGRCRGPWTA